MKAILKRPPSARVSETLSPPPLPTLPKRPVAALVSAADPSATVLRKFRRSFADCSPLPMSHPSLRCFASARPRAEALPSGLVPVPRIAGAAFLLYKRQCVAFLMRVILCFMDNTHTEVPKLPTLKDRRFGGWRRDGRQHWRGRGRPLSAMSSS